MVRSALVPKDQQFFSVWLDNHFSIYGDKEPNRDEVQLSVNSKKEIFKMFDADAKKNSIHSVGYNTFVNLWNDQFLRVKSSSSTNETNVILVISSIEKKVKQQIKKWFGILVLLINCIEVVYTCWNGKSKCDTF